MFYGFHIIDYKGFDRKREIKRKRGVLKIDVC